MAERYFQHTFPNGLTLLGERMPGMQSAAMMMMLPAGAASDPVGRTGSATVVGEMLLRGAGARDSRQLTDYLDFLGLQRSSGVGVHHTRFGCAAVAEKVVEAIEVYSDIVRRPHLPADGFESARDLALQSLAGIDDDPRSKVSIKLREWHWPSPYGRNPMGEVDDLQKLTHEQCKADYARRFHAKDVILAFAGNIDFEQIKAEVNRHFGDWNGSAVEHVATQPPPGNFHFMEQQSEQTHIGIAYPTVLEVDPNFYAARLSLEVLSGGMSSRLFTEVREKRGLCYSVGANFAGLKGIASVLGYAGSSNDRAQATLDCYLAEVHRLSDGVQADELDRAKIGLKASIIMSGESTSARAGAIAHDYFMRGRIRPLEEISSALDSVTVEQVNAYLKSHRPGPFTVVIVGPKELTMPVV